MTSTPTPDSSAPAVTVRPARLEDLPAVADLLLADSSRGSEPDLAPYAAMFARMTAASGHVLALAELDAQVVGTLQLSLVPSFVDTVVRAHVDGVHTLSSLRGRGIGEALFAWAVDQARARGASSVHLAAPGSSANVQRYYEQLGFTQDSVGYSMRLR